MPLSISGAGGPSHSPTRGGRRVSVGSSSDVELGEERVHLARGRPPPARGRARTSGPGILAPRPARPRVQRASRSGWGIALGVAVDPLEVARDDVRRDVAVVGIALLDVVAEAAQALGRRDRRRRAARSRAGRSRRAASPPSRRSAARRRRRHVRVRRSAVLDRVEEQRGVAHAARQRAADRHAVPVAAHRHAVALRLEPEEPAGGGGDPDRPGAVGRERRGAEPGGDRGGGAAARAAARAGRVPRVAGRAERERLGHRQRLELGHVRLAEDHRAGRAQAAHHLGVRRAARSRARASRAR